MQWLKGPFESSWAWSAPVARGVLVTIGGTLGRDRGLASENSALFGRILFGCPAQRLGNSFKMLHGVAVGGVLHLTADLFAQRVAAHHDGDAALRSGRA